MEKLKEDVKKGMEKLKEDVKKGIKEGRALVSHRIDSDDLELGDHIYIYRAMSAYSHHGIYIGEGYVIHFIQTKTETIANPKPPCQKCSYQKGKHRGVVKTCRDCFRSIDNNLLGGHSLHRYRYGEPSENFAIKKPGCCSTRAAKSADEVVQTATQLHNESSFGNYHLFNSNCEDFATFCKTGTCHSAQVDAVKNKPVTSVATTVATVVGIGVGAVAVGLTAVIAKRGNKQK